jgi:hypothetical protein
MVTRSEIAAALGYTPYSSYNPAAYLTIPALAPYALTSSVPVASSLTPVMDGTAAVGVATSWARGDHVHPTLSSAVMTANFLTWMASLPTTLPASSGKAWNNGGMPCVS